METDKNRLKGPSQVLNSRGNINAKKRATYDEITDIKFKNEKHEKDRRDLDEYQRQTRFTTLQNEAIESSKQNAALEMKWAALKEIDEYESLYKEIVDQKDSFQRILDSKNALIALFKDDLRKKDDDYRRILKEENEDIDSIIHKMRQQFYKLRDMHLNELNEIEHKFDQDRGDLLRGNKGEIDKKSNRHAELEKKIVEDREATEKRNMDEIEKLRIEYAKSYADRKISMETEIQNLEKCLEDMKALYLLNTEKLDYNFKVLKEKDEENTILTNILKNKKRNYSNRLTKARNDYKEIDRKFKQENKALTDEYKRITRQFKELQNKFKHFEKADKDRYEEIKKMNEAEIQELKEKLVKCDKTVHIQQLGMQWSPPNLERIEESKEDQSLTGSLRKDATRGDEDFQFTIPPLDMEIITEILLIETDFLLDEKTRERIRELQIFEDDPEDVQQEKAETARRIKIETLKKTLELDSLQQMNLLYETLYSNIRSLRKNKVLEDNNEEEEGAEEAEEEENEDDDGEIEYDPDAVIEALTKFMEGKQGQKDQSDLSPTRKAIAKTIERERKEKDAKEEKFVWEKLTQVLPDHTFRIWRVLDKSLSKYHDLLLDRQKLIEQTGELHNQNEELKNLLNQYFQINHELIIPPTKMIQLEASQSVSQ